MRVPTKTIELSGVAEVQASRRLTFTACGSRFWPARGGNDPLQRSVGYLRRVDTMKSEPSERERRLSALASQTARPSARLLAR